MTGWISTAKTSGERYHPPMPRLTSKDIARKEEMMDWITEEKMPKYDDIREFEVWIYGYVRRVRRVGNRHPYFHPGMLVYVDCTDSMQNVICDEAKIKGWRHSSSTESSPVWQQERLPGQLRGNLGTGSRLRLV